VADRLWDWKDSVAISENRYYCFYHLLDSANDDNNVLTYDNRVGTVIAALVSASFSTGGTVAANAASCRGRLTVTSWQEMRIN